MIDTRVYGLSLPALVAIKSVCAQLAELATCPDTTPKFEEDKGSRQEKHADASKDGATPINPNVLIHWPHKQRKRSCHQGPDKCVGGNGTRAVACKCVDEVLERCLEDGGEADSYQEHAHNRRPRVGDVLRRSP